MLADAFLCLAVMCI